MSESRQTVEERQFYLEDIPIEAARAAWQQALAAVGRWGALAGDVVPVAEALGRVTAEPVFAMYSTPHYHAAAMDGYAVAASETLAATETRPVRLALGAAAVAVNTGDALPAGMNAVIMIENVQHPDAATIEIVAPVAPWQHVRMAGEDMVATELVLPANRVLRPVDLGAVAGCGHATVSVRRRPRVVIVPTGSELVSAAEAAAGVQPGQIIEFNSIVLGAQVRDMGGEVTVLPITPDDPAKLRAALEQAVATQPDLVLMLSGSSAGSRDFTAKLVAELGTLLVHGVAVRPGHPVILGMIGAVAVLGVPGYPVSAALTGELFMQPVLAQWLGIAAPMATRPVVTAQLTRKMTSPIGDDDFVRVTVAKVGDRLLATPLSRGAGVITSLVKADGLLHIPRFKEGADAGELLPVRLYRPLREVEAAVLHMGSHDPMLDLLAQYMGEMPLTSANVGSLGGLVALKRGEAHVAGCHLLDEATGEYNTAYVQKYLPGQRVKLVTFAQREQDLMVLPGNPAGIGGLDDLTRVRFVNRQRGSGTRLLLDYELKQRGIESSAVGGYEREEYTHLGVAVAVKTGIADCGLGVRSAATALGLDFVPVGWERYELVIPEAHWGHAGVGRMIEVLQGEGFKAALGAVPGYAVGETGVMREV